MPSRRTFCRGILSTISNFRLKMDKVLDRLRMLSGFVFDIVEFGLRGKGEIHLHGEISIYYIILYYIISTILIKEWPCFSFVTLSRVHKH